jgi:FkbM family methyltransferase
MLAIKIFFKEIFYLLRNHFSRAFLGLAFWYGGKKRYHLTTLKYLQYKLQVPDCLSFIWQVKEIFVDESYRFASTKRKPVIYDCGANIGTACLYFKRIFPYAEIKAFEADPKIADMLQNNLSSNKIQDVEVIAKAVWVHNEGVEIALEGSDGASIFGTANKSKVPSVRLKDLLDIEPEIDLLKMDIEGAETQVLEDCQEMLHKTKHIFIEYHAYIGQSQDLDKILVILSNNGFRYFVDNVLPRRSPLVNKVPKSKDNGMDLQLNIYGYK